MAARILATDARVAPSHATLTALGIALRKTQQRIFRCDYVCEACDNQWTDYMLTAGPSWCPACERRLDPYCATEFLEEGVEFDIEEDE